MTAHSISDPAFDFETADFAEVERFVGDVYAGVRMMRPTTEAPARLRVRRRPLGPISIEDHDAGFGMRFAVDPLRKLCLVYVREGLLRREVAGERITCGPGQVTSMGAPDEPVVGEIHLVRHDTVLLDEGLLGRVAQIPPGAAHGSVRLTGHEPVTPEAGRFLVSTIGYVRDRLLGNAHAAGSALIAATAAQHLAVTVLQTFPNNALLDPTTGDRLDSGPALLRRAKAFVDENAQRTIALSDIATSVHVTPRALQYMFRRHMDCTPMEYVRRVRLEHAHRDLVAADGTFVTVAFVAAKWGFAHTGRFAVAYRRVYGRSPHVTLRSN